MRRLVRFCDNDPAALWRRGDLAEDLGWESVDEKGRPATSVRKLRLVKSGELLAISDPFARGLIERCEER